MNGQTKDHTFRLSKEKKNNVESSIEPPTAKSYSSASGRFFHSGSHIIFAQLGIWNKLHFKSGRLMFLAPCPHACDNYPIKNTPSSHGGSTSNVLPSKHIKHISHTSLQCRLFLWGRNGDSPKTLMYHRPCLNHTLPSFLKLYCTKYFCIIDKTL